MSIGIAELFIISVIFLLPAFVTYIVLKERDRLRPWKVIVTFFTGWLDAAAFIIFDRQARN